MIPSETQAWLSSYFDEYKLQDMQENTYSNML